MIDRRIKTIAVIVLCMGINTLGISLAPAQQISNTLKNKLGYQKVMAKWRPKLKKFNTPELRKSHEYAELRNQVLKELQEMRDKNSTAQAQTAPMQANKKTDLRNNTQPLGMQAHYSTQIDTLQQHKPSLTVVSKKSIEAITCYSVPVASKGNTIELSVSNTLTLSAEEVKVTVNSIPEGIEFTEKTIALPTLKAKEKQTAMFTFSVGKTAKISKQDTLHFAITDKTGQTWMKNIAIVIAPPATYELLQNYPNPFNPSTTIEYQLPGTETRYNVSLKIYDAIGREITNLVNEQQAPGYYQKTFDASRYASGMYVYRLVATDEQNHQHVFQKKMLMLK